MQRMKRENIKMTEEAKKKRSVYDNKKLLLWKS